MVCRVHIMSPDNTPSSNQSGEDSIACKFNRVLIFVSGYASSSVYMFTVL